METGLLKLIQLLWVCLFIFKNVYPTPSLVSFLQNMCFGASGSFDLQGGGRMGSRTPSTVPQAPESAGGVVSRAGAHVSAPQERGLRRDGPAHPWVWVSSLQDGEGPVSVVGPPTVWYLLRSPSDLVYMSHVVVRWCSWRLRLVLSWGSFMARPGLVIQGQLTDWRWPVQPGARVPLSRAVWPSPVWTFRHPGPKGLGSLHRGDTWLPCESCFSMV